MTEIEYAAERAMDAARDDRRGTDDWLVNDWKHVVRAVLLAIREPSDAMMAAGAESVPGDNHPARKKPEAAREVWYDMIDAILKEPT